MDHFSESHTSPVIKEVTLMPGKPPSAPPLLLHLTRNLDDLASILRGGKVAARNPFGALHDHSTLATGQHVVCLSELGLEHVEELATGRHTPVGIGLHRAWAAAQGAAPVWYLPRETPVQQHVFNLVKQLAYEREPDPDHPLWQLTPFIDYPQEGGTYDFRWEREWRVRGDLQFDPLPDIAVLFAPERDHDAMRETWVWEALDFPRGPVPPLVDPAWEMERKMQVLRNGHQDYDSEGDTDPTPKPEDDDHDFFSGPVTWVSDQDRVRTEQQSEWAHWLHTFERDDI